MTVVGTQEVQTVRQSHPLRDGIALIAFQNGAQTISTEDYQDISVQLWDIHHLFIAPEGSPLEADWQPISGIDQIFNALKPHRLNRNLRIRIALPKAQIEPELREQVQAAINRYVQAKIQQNTVELASLRWQAIKALQTGILFLGICLTISTLGSQAEFLPEWARTLVGEGFLIAGWVSIWHPTELFLYAWWPLWRDIQVCKKVSNAEVIIEDA